MNYFIHDERDLSPAYVKSSKKFLKAAACRLSQAPSFLSQCGISYDKKAKCFKMKKQKATSSKPQAASAMKRPQLNDKIKI